MSVGLEVSGMAIPFRVLYAKSCSVELTHEPRHLKSVNFFRLVVVRGRWFASIL